MNNKSRTKLCVAIVVLCHLSVFINQAHPATLNQTNESTLFIQQVEIPKGAFQFGCSVDDSLCAKDEGPIGGVRVDVPSFKIDVYETSVAEYRACVNSGKCSPPFDYRRSHYCNYDAPQRENYPVNCVNWIQALAYCEWRGARLAYEVEWEKAARGGTTSPYYWGYQPANCDRVVMDAGQPGQPDNTTDGCWRDLSWERGSFPPNPYGLFDVIGGTSEWVMDWYDQNSHQKLYQHGFLTGPKTGSTKTIKSGSWDEKHWAQRVSNRYNKPRTGNPDLYGSNGIRCVTPDKSSLGFPLSD